MSAQNQNKPLIGRILLDGGFLSPKDLDMALAEQLKTNELLGQALVRMGLLDPVDLSAALSVQEYLSEPGDAVKAAGGVRKMLGELLLQAEHITDEQLEQALLEQKNSGGMLGEVLMRMGLLTERQLTHVLDFQQNQGDIKPSPLRLGEILVSAGYISREQLDDALYKQTLSGKRLGEVLIEEGHAEQHHIHHGIRLQHMLVTAALIGLLTACGPGVDGGGNVDTQGATSTSVETALSQQEEQANYFTITKDDYGLETLNFYYSTNNDSFWSIQADNAESVYDPNFKCIIRIDVQKENGSMPTINKTFSIEDNSQYEKFPGSFLVPNGQESTKKKVEQGTISFTSDSTASGTVNGSFDVILTDYDSATVPAPQYQIKGDFNLKMGTFGSMTTVVASAS